MVIDINNNYMEEPYISQGNIVYNAVGSGLLIWKKKKRSLLLPHLGC